MMVPRFLQDICYNQMAFSAKIINKFAAVYPCGRKHKRKETFHKQKQFVQTFLRALPTL